MKQIKIDWYLHYLKKHSLKLDTDILLTNFKTDLPYLQLVGKYIKPGSAILECGCGLARTCMSLALSGYNVTAIDIDKKMLQTARSNAKKASLDDKIKFKLLNFYNIEHSFADKGIKCITHQGVVEHFAEDQIEGILKIQLRVAPYIIFSVPLDSDFNKVYFNDNIYRNLWTKKYWLETVLKDFKVEASKTVRQRSDNLLIVIHR